MKMTTTNIPIDKNEDKDFMPFELRLPDEAPGTSDKRREPRKQRIVQLKCKIYNFELDTFENIDTLVHNYSANGLYFEAAIPFQPDDPVFLLLKDQLLDKCDSELAKGVHAQILWCKHLDTGFDPRYGVGVKYFEPITI
jgi:hypothetical protein